MVDGGGIFAENIVKGLNKGAWQLFEHEQLEKRITNIFNQEIRK